MNEIIHFNEILGKIIISNNIFINIFLGKTFTTKRLIQIYNILKQMNNYMI